MYFNWKNLRSLVQVLSVKLHMTDTTNETDLSKTCLRQIRYMEFETKLLYRTAFELRTKSEHSIAARLKTYV